MEYYLNVSTEYLNYTLTYYVFSYACSFVFLAAIWLVFKGEGRSMSSYMKTGKSDWKNTIDFRQVSADLNKLEHCHSVVLDTRDSY